MRGDRALRGRQRSCKGGFSQADKFSHICVARNVLLLSFLLQRDAREVIALAVNGQAIREGTAALNC